jgi:hypothetical protein
VFNVIRLLLLLALAYSGSEVAELRLACAPFLSETIANSDDLKSVHALALLEVI